MKDVESQKKLKQFISHGLHEMRTSVQIISGYLEIMAPKNFTAKEKHIITQETRHLSKLLHKLLRLYKAHETKEKFELLQLESFDMIELIKNIFDTFDHKNRHFDFRLQIDPEITEKIICFHDLQEIESLIKTLLENAFKYTPKKQIILLGLSPAETPDQIKIWVRNQGIGISSEHHQRIFQPFVRLDKEKKGTGLGLAIAHEIVRLHQGEIEMQTDEKNFVHFQIRLPKKPF